MGIYLSSPITTTEPEDGSDGIKKLNYGASSMQGWRVSQEDAHNCILDFDSKTGASFFAVYDGHGGDEVAKYCADHLPSFVKQTESYETGDFEKGLYEAFMAIDAHLLKDEAMSKLKSLVTQASDSSDGEEISGLFVDAKTPLVDVLKRYHNGNSSQVSTDQKTQEEDVACSSAKSKSDTSSKDVSNVDSGSCGDTSVGGSSKETVENDVEEKAEKEKISDGNVESSEMEALGNGADKPVIDGPALSDGVIDDGSDPNVCGSSKSAVVSNSGFSNGLTSCTQDSDDVILVEEEDESSDEDEIVTSKELLGACDDDGDEDFCDSSSYEMEDSGEESDDSVEDIASPTSQGPGYESGCTANVVLIHGSQIFVANAGDSRCVLCRSGKAIELSEDHKPEDEKERTRIEKANGVVSLEGRVNDGLNLSRAIGDHCYKTNEVLGPEEQMIISSPDIQKIEIVPGDEFIVIACDGIWNSLSSQEVVDFVKQRLKSNDGAKLSTICDQLFMECLAPGSDGDGTGCDNMTCIIVRLNYIQTDISDADVGQCKRKIEDNEETTKVRKIDS